nr:MAG TPA: hypothetical protein [Caudoviricetes sp.]
MSRNIMPSPRIRAIIIILTLNFFLVSKVLSYL